MRDKAADTGVLTRWGAGSCATCLIYRPQHGRGHVQLKERPSASASGKSTRADSAHTTVNWRARGACACTGRLQARVFNTHDNPCA